MTQDFFVTVYFANNARDALLCRSFGSRAEAVQYARGAACGVHVSLVCITRAAGNLEGFIQGRAAIALPDADHPERDLILPVYTMTCKAVVGVA